jgi:hypothetical protein
MNLLVHVPDDATEESAGAVSLARRAPEFAIEESNGRRTAVARFPLIPEGIDLAVALVGEAVQLPGAWATANDHRLSSLAKLWQRLLCYRESLTAGDPARYCLEKAALFHTLVGCEGLRCPVPCQFLCTPCLAIQSQDVLLIRPESRFRSAAELAEVEWCPRLYAAN